MIQGIRPAKLQNSDFQSHFYMSITQVFLEQISLEDINLGAQL